MKKEKTPFPTVGASSLLVIFAVLCLTVFAMLTLNTAQSATKLSVLSAENTVAYYSAELEANEILARLRNGEHVQDVIIDGNVYSYSCKISDVQVLNVTVKIDSANDYTVLKWQRASAKGFEADDLIDIWDGIF